MHQLSPVDTYFATENASSFKHMLMVNIFDPAETGRELTLEKIRSLLQARIHELPALRWRMVEVPLGLDEPYWVDDPTFSLDKHLRELALPAPGDDRQLAALVTHLVPPGLDRSKPLWELYLVTGLEGGRAAVVLKLSHAAFDGATGNRLLMTLLDTTVEPRTAAPSTGVWEPATVPGGFSMLARGVKGLAARPLKMAGAAYRLQKETVVPVLANLLRKKGDAGNGLLNQLPQPAPKLVFNDLVTSRRSWGFAEESFSDFKQIKTAYGATVNDVVLSVCAASLRRWLQQRGRLPDRNPIAQVPISTRSGADGEAAGNAVSGMYVELPTDRADPLARLQAVRRSTQAAKAQTEALGNDFASNASVFLLPALMARAGRIVDTGGVTRRLPLMSNLTISNVPGPRQKLYLAGTPMVSSAVCAGAIDMEALTIIVTSYLDKVTFAVTSCPDVISGDAPRELLGYIHDDLSALAGAASALISAKEQGEVDGERHAPTDRG